MKYHFLFLALFCFQLFAINCETLDKKKGFLLIGTDKWTEVTSSQGGDVNGDGYPDMFIANSAHSNEYMFATVIYGGPTVSLNDIEGGNFTSKQGFRIRNTQVTAEFKSINLVDLNKDGYADLVIMTQSRQERLVDLYVIFGGRSLRSMDLSEMSSTQGFKIEGLGVGRPESAQVRAAGDVNGDGYQDLMIKPAGETVFVVYGRPNMTTFNINNMTSEQGFKFTFTNKSMKHYFYSFSSAGDINNDGYADLLIPVLRSKPNNKFSLSGHIFVIYGGKSLPNFEVYNMTSSQGFNISMSTDMQMGPGVGSAGDFNKDGYADFLVSDIEDNNAAGAVYVVYGGNSLASFDISNLTETQGVKITGDNEKEYHVGALRFGESLSAAGDFNKDGYADIIIGAPSKRSDNGTMGVAYIIYGGKSLSTINAGNITSSQGLLVTNPRENGYMYGSEVNKLGDVNKDGYDDVMITVRPEPKEYTPTRAMAHIVFGAPNA